MSRPSALELSITLRRIADEKAEHLEKWRKQRPDHWIAAYERDIDHLRWAAVGYDKLAERETAIANEAEQV